MTSQELRNSIAKECFVAAFTNAGDTKLDIGPGQTPLQALTAHWQGAARASIVAADAFVAALGEREAAPADYAPESQEFRG